MKVDWNGIYEGRGLYSGHGSRGSCAALKVRTIRDVVERLRPQTFLDVGCGDLHVIRQVDLGSTAYTGLDSSKVLVDKLRAEGETRSLVTGDFLEMPISHVWDLTMCLDVLIHLTSLEEYKAFAKKLLSTARRGLLVSGFSRPTPGNTGSRVVHFYESIFETFRDHQVISYGEYRDCSLVLVLPNSDSKCESTGHVAATNLPIPKAAKTPRRIWAYWENPPGQTRSEYLDLCEQTWRRHCGDDFEITCVTPESVEQHAPNLPSQWSRIPCMAHKADYLRAVLLHRNGGIWLDADTIVLQNLREMTDRLDASGSDFLGCGRPGNRPSNGIFAAKPGSLLLERYIAAMNEFLETRGEDLRFRWTELGYSLLWPLTREYSYFQYDFRVCIPIHPSRYKVFFEETPLKDLPVDVCDVRDDTLTVYLYNAMFPVAFKRLSSQEILKSRTVIGQLFRLALGIPTDDELLHELSAVKHRNRLAGVLRACGRNQAMCEVGVRAGHHLNAILNAGQPELLVGVDHWQGGLGSSRNDIGLSQLQQSQLEERVRERFKSLGDRCRIVRAESSEAALKFPDESFDYVYLDADHSYDAIRGDLAAWYPKVRIGGVLAGHDYVERTTKYVEFGVVRAVKEFVRDRGIRHFAITDEASPSWIVLKDEPSETPSFCYWSVGFGEKHHSFLRAMVKSARKLGVRQDIHVWTDVSSEIRGCITHKYEPAKHSAPNYMFKLQLLLEMSKFSYDYCVFLDADSYFVRRPHLQAVFDLADPLHLHQETPINSPDYTDEQMRTRAWHGMNLYSLVEAFAARGICGKSLFLNNAGFFVVKRTGLEQVYQTCWEGFRYFHDELGFQSVTEEIAFAWAMAKLSIPSRHRVTRSELSEIWCTDRGCFRGRLPTGEPFQHWLNWTGTKWSVNPAIVHAHKSKQQLSDYAAD